MEQTISTKKQDKITYEVKFILTQERRKLIKLMIQDKMTIKQAHEELGINYSTAKMIIRKYKDNGKITKFKT